jgi:hypothetical protein
MGGKKGLIIVIALVFLGIIGYFIFSGDKESDQGSKTFSGFSGRLFGSSDKDKLSNRGSENFRKQTESLNNGSKDTISQVNGSSTNQTNQITQGNTTNNGGNSSSNFDANYNYNFEGGDSITKKYSQNTQFSINGKEGEVKDYTTGNSQNGSGSGDGSGGFVRRKNTSKPLTPSEIESTALFKECIQIVTPVLDSNNKSFNQVQSALMQLSGFNVLSQILQNQFINDIIEKKYGSDATKYCQDIVGAIANAFSELDIYQECVGIVTNILAMNNPSKIDIKARLSAITGFDLLSNPIKNDFIDSLFSKKYGNNAGVYCVDITKAILDGMEGLAVFKQCVKIVSALLQQNADAAKVKTALFTLTGFTMLTEQDQQTFINNIVTKQYGENAARYCIDIVSAIIDALDPAKLYKQCIAAMKEILKAKELTSGDVTEEVILTKLSLMGIFNGVVDSAQRKVMAQNYFGTEYDKIIADIKTLTSSNFDKKSAQICAKIVSAITNSITDENTFGECILALNKVKRENNTTAKLSDIIPSVTDLSSDSFNKISNMFKSFLSGGNITAEEICTFLVKQLANENGLNNSDNNNDGSSSNNQNEASSNSEEQSIAQACSDLVEVIDSQYQNSLSNPGMDPITTVVSKIPSFQFYIPEQSKGEVIQKTILAYLSKPEVNAQGATIHRDTELKMNNQNMDLFSKLSTHEKNKISERLYDLSYTATLQKNNHISTDTISKEIYPYLCKCSHPDFDDTKWNNSLSSFLQSKKTSTTTQSLPTDEIQKSIEITTSPFYKKCTDSVSTLTSEDTTASKVFAKIKISLPEIIQLNTQEGDLSSLTCYATACYGKTNCSISCETAIGDVCENLTEKYLTLTPQSTAVSAKDAFACTLDPSQSYNLIKLHCLEVGSSYYTSTTDKETFVLHCYDSISAILDANKTSPTSITKTNIIDYLSSNTRANYKIFTNLDSTTQNNIASSIYNKIQIGELDYNQTIEKSCYDFSDTQREQLSGHFVIGMDYFIKDAEQVRNDIIKELWTQNEERRMKENRPIYYDTCIKVSKEYWDKLLLNEQVRQGKTEDLALPPSPQCKCYIDSIYSLLDERAITSDTECEQITGEIKGALVKMKASSDASSTSMPTSDMLKKLAQIPYFGDISYTIRTEIASAISTDLANIRSTTPTSTLDKNIYLSKTKQQTYCTQISQNVAFGSGDNQKCLDVLATISYETSKQPTKSPSNLVCNLFADTIEKSATDTGQIDFFPSDNIQFKDIRLSTCTQKLRAVYRQIETMKTTYWADGEDWTYKRTSSTHPECSQVSNYLSDKESLSQLQGLFK